MVTVIAKITAKKNMIAQTKSLLQALVAPTHLEEGCISYILHQDETNSDVFFFYEKWQSHEHLVRHSVSSHLEAYKLRIKDLVLCPTEVYILSTI